MALLADYAITPDVFDVRSYSTGDECEARIDSIRETMLDGGVVRDLRDSAWSLLLLGAGPRPWHPRGRELLKKMKEQGRLLPFASALPQRPADDRAWCAEALATDDVRPFRGGVITTRSVKDGYVEDPRVARIDRLSSAPWWSSRSPSVRLQRTSGDYEEHLDLLLRFSSSLRFIDPHLDPGKRRYGSFGKLLQRAGNRVPAPRIQIHRVCYEGSGPGRRLPLRDDPMYFQQMFHDALADPLRVAELQADVFIWRDFHDRYVISNLIGISLQNGFDVSSALGDSTTWSRLGRDNRDAIQHEFVPAARPGELVKHFSIPVRA